VERTLLHVVSGTLEPFKQLGERRFGAERPPPLRVTRPLHCDVTGTHVIGCGGYPL
jgi:hypothetical protein